MNSGLATYILFLFAFAIFAFVSTFLTTPHLRNYMGEKLFLHYHYHRTSIYVLEFASNKYNSNYKTYFLLGRVYFVEGELGKSVQNYSKSIVLNPTHKESYYGRGLSYGFSPKKYLIPAQNDFERYIILEQLEFEKSGERAYGAWAGYNDLAWIHFLKGEFELQEKVSREGLKISVYNPWLQNMLGVSLLAQKKCLEAKPYLESAIAILQTTSAQQFGEAYSGDSSYFWKIGLENMKKVIGENIRLCEEN